MRPGARSLDIGAVLVLLLAVLANVAGTAAAVHEHHHEAPVVTTGAESPASVLAAGDGGGSGEAEERCLFCEPLRTIALPASGEGVATVPVASARSRGVPLAPPALVVPLSPSARAPPAI